MYPQPEKTKTKA
jgi:hypothetical protein